MMGKIVNTMTKTKSKFSSVQQKAEYGFTLIELMMVVAIIALIATMAYPSYTDYVLKSRRSEATSALMQIAAKQEQYFMDNRTYTSDLTDLDYSASPFITDNGYYSITANVPNAFEFTLTATPDGAQSADTGCATITLDHEGNKGHTGTAASCWQ